MKRIYFLLAAVCFAASAQAQLGFGIEVGLNGSNYSVKDTGHARKTDARYGGRIGIITDIAITDNFFLQPGIFYNSNGFTINHPTGYEIYSVNTIEVPINIEYKIGLLGMNRFFVGAGPYFGLNKGGYYKVHAGVVDSRRDLRIGGHPTDDIKVFDMGVGANAGYQLTAGLFIRLRGQLGLIDLQPKTSALQGSLKSYNYSLSIGYIFYRRDKDGKIRIDRDRQKENNLDSKQQRKMIKKHSILNNTAPDTN